MIMLTKQSNVPPQNTPSMMKMKVNKKQRKRHPAQQNKSDMKHISDPDRKPHANNVLCGRYQLAFCHEGNAYFRRLIKSFKLDYITGTTRQKKEYSQIIYNKIRQLNPPGQFLKYNPQTSTWEDLGEKKSFYKIKQALREGAPTLKHSLKTQLMLKNNTYSDKIKSIYGEATCEERSLNMENKSSNNILKVDAANTTNFREISPLSESVSSRKNTQINFGHELIDMDKSSERISSNTTYPRLENNNKMLNALPGPRIVPTRYF